MESEEPRYRESSDDSVESEVEFVKNLVFFGFSHCKQCLSVIPLLPGIPGVREERPAFRRQTAWGCAGCKVNLCSWACMLAWDHQNQCQRREVVLQYAQTQAVGPATEPVPVESPATGAGPSRRGRSFGDEPAVELAPKKSNRGGARRHARGPDDPQGAR